jgi:rhodanese-related sulfurtransferase
MQEWLSHRCSVRWQADDGVQLVDVREPSERDIAALPGFQLYPLSQVAVWAPKVEQLLDPERETIVLCHHGVRSMQMASVSSGLGWPVMGCAVLCWAVMSCAVLCCDKWQHGLKSCLESRTCIWMIHGTCI